MSYFVLSKRRGGVKMPDSIRPQLSLNPTPVLSCAKTSPPLAKGRGLRGGVKPTWNKSLKVKLTPMPLPGGICGLLKMAENLQ
jgi:hypothetical protein